MITRSHTKDDAPSTAVYSDCERYRYSLTRTWDPATPKVLFVMLNPSRATEIENDPTVERCETRARMLGYGAFQVANIFAWRETHPRLMRQAAEPIGPENDHVLSNGVMWADSVIAAWGVHGTHLNRGSDVIRLMVSLKAPLYHLGLTKAGHPKHPLYISYAQEPVAWRP
tara:strand:+ start:561 stop:1070 length:510 start_codon:yes stop_codon:yes gene_type:complete